MSTSTPKPKKVNRVGLTRMDYQGRPLHALFRVWTRRDHKSNYQGLLRDGSESVSSGQDERNWVRQ